MTMKKAMFLLVVLSGAGCLIFALLGERFDAFAITFGTTFYHIGMRLAVGYLFLLVKRDFKPDKGWFAERRWERRLYARIKVRAWKDKVPSYNPEDFSLEKHTLEEIIQTMCISELVHETIMVFSFIPLLFAIPFGEFLVFLLTSLAAAAFDCIFVILQRFNRPRVLAMMRRRKL